MGPPIGALRIRWAACASRQSLYTTDRHSDYWLTAEPGQEKWLVKLFQRISLLWLSWMVIFQKLVGCHVILLLGKSLIKRRQRPDWC